MKIWDFEKFFFRLNVFLTLITFALLAPTTRIFASWFPDKEDSLWMLPLAVIGISSFIWFLTSLLLPYLIRFGIFEERRQTPRPPIIPRSERYARMTAPVLNTAIHLVLLVLFCFCAVVFMRSDALENLFVNLP